MVIRERESVMKTFFTIFMMNVLLVASVAFPASDVSTQKEQEEKKSTQENGGTEKDELSSHESPVRAGLDWLMRHQNPDGSWSSRNFIHQCSSKTGPCKTEGKPEKGGGDPYGRGVAGHDVAVTALAMLSFTGYGHTHEGGRYPEYIKVLQKGVHFLSSRIADTGPRTSLLDHAIATMVLSELLLMSGDFLHLKKPVEDACALCMLTQNRNGGWGRTPGDRRSSTSVTSWMMLALKTAKICKDLELFKTPSCKEIDDAFKGGLEWYDRVTENETGLVRDRTFYFWEKPDIKEPKRDSFYVDGVPVFTAMSMLCRLFAGERRSTETIKKGVTQVMQFPPDQVYNEDGPHKPINFVYLYFGTFAAFQFGGEVWKKWHQGVNEILISHQRKAKASEPGGCVDGSWDPDGFWSRKGGRVAATALSLLSLEVYYRYERAKGGEGF